MAEPAPLAALPPELLHAVALHLSVRDVGRLACAWRAAAAVLREDHLWRALLRRDFGVEASGGDARGEYRLMGTRMVFARPPRDPSERPLVRVRRADNGLRRLRKSTASGTLLLFSKPCARGIAFVDLACVLLRNGNTVLGVRPVSDAAGADGFFVCLGSGVVWRNPKRPLDVERMHAVPEGGRILCVLDQTGPEAFVYFGQSTLTVASPNEYHRFDDAEIEWRRMPALPGDQPLRFFLGLDDRHDAVDELPTRALPASFFAARARWGRSDAFQHDPTDLSSSADSFFDLSIYDTESDRGFDEVADGDDVE